ncbi:hypothetical protein Leryth_019890 [Lithospermum erythrorhizon]|nr:hypothetical protein Leryth_019890 [Lithospermum erythrorhizon]
MMPLSIKSSLNSKLAFFGASTLLQIGGFNSADNSTRYNACIEAEWSNVIPDLPLDMPNQIKMKEGSEMCDEYVCDQQPNNLERRPLPNQGFTCCLAMDGVKVMASGFDIDEKVEIGKLVAGMGGVLQLALNDLKKPIVTKDWVYQCWKEHRVVPQESYKVLPFTGLRICVSRIPAVERKEMEKLILQNGGKYSAELTRKCTHLVCDKYVVAKQWGHILIVTRKWFDQSLSRRVCLNEESYPVQSTPASSLSISRKKARHSQETSSGISQCAKPSAGMASSSELCGPTISQDPEVTVSHNIFTVVSEVSMFNNDGETEPPPTHPTTTCTNASEPNVDIPLNNCIANDSQTEDNDLYLSECRITIVGFEASELRKLVSIVRRGGGSRYMHFNEKLTHIVVGSPSEIEIRETRTLASRGIIHVVKKESLEDCDWEKKEFPDGRLLDVGSHILYSPLPCQIPFVSLEKFKICISQYNEKERSLLKNLCFVLGTKFTEKLTKSVTHLLCKFASGPKYEASCKWGMQSVTAEWLYECIKQNKVIDPDPFHPKQATSQEREAGLCTMSQYPTQAFQMTSGDNASQLPIQSEELKNVQNESHPRKVVGFEETVPPSSCRKREASIAENPTSMLSSVSKQFDHGLTVLSTKNNMEESAKVVSEFHDDVAAIEDLL